MSDIDNHRRLFMVIDQVKTILQAIKNRKFSNVYFISCGGSNALMYPSQYFLDTHASRLFSEYLNAAEFIHRSPKALGEDSVVIVCSQEGATPETVNACKFAREKGATTIALSMVDDSPLEKEAEFHVKYGYYETADAIDTSYGVMYLLSAGILEAQEGVEIFRKMENNLIKLTPVINEAKRQYGAKAAQFGVGCSKDPVIYVLGSGADYSQAYVLCNCYLMEMQWINAIPIHAGEFFHGPFEIIERNSPVVILLGQDETRPLEERALSFVQKFSDRVFALDTNEVDFMDIDEDFKGVCAPLVLNNICRMHAKAIARARNHSLDLRRYMHLFEY